MFTPHKSFIVLGLGGGLAYIDIMNMSDLILPGSPLASLDARARSVFADLVQTYLSTGQAVGSKSLAQNLSEKGGLSLSPATIRSIMSELSQLGLLGKDHISSGRRPTQQGLRLFVDGLLEIGDLPKSDRSRLEAQIKASNENPEDILSRASSVLSGLAGGAGLVLTPSMQSPLRHVEFVSLDERKALAVLVYADGQVENRLMNLPLGVLPAQLEQAGNYLSARLKGKTLDQSRTQILSELNEGRAALDNAATNLIKQGLADWSGDKKRSLIVRGRSRLLDNVQAQTDLERVQRLFEELERKEALIDLLDRTETAEGVKIFIGSENPLFALSGSSMVVAPYVGADAQIIGAVAVIGPTRLNYARVIPMVDYTAQIVGRLLGNPKD